MAKLINLVGKKYSRLTVLSFAGRDKFNHRIYTCICDCGKTVDVRSSLISSGKTKSCGCLHNEIVRDLLLKHNESHSTKEYLAWIGMRKRCLNPNSKFFNHYGGRGINICKRWDKYENFLADMGRSPSKEHSLDRKDNNGDYTPSNCRWATRTEQNNNTSRVSLITFNKQTKSLPDWCRDLDLNYKTTRARIYVYGWSLDEALQSGKRNRGQ